ncbi:MAG: hypothetical protein ABIO70_28900 [Pseudomonadota bacterium]
MIIWKAQKLVRQDWEDLKSAAQSLPPGWSRVHSGLAPIKERVDDFLGRGGFTVEDARVEELQADIGRLKYLITVVQPIGRRHEAIRQSLRAQSVMVGGTSIRDLLPAVERWVARWEAELTELEAGTTDKHDAERVGRQTAEVEDGVALLGQALAVLLESEDLIRNAASSVRVEATGAATQRDAFIRDLGAGILTEPQLAAFKEVLQAMRAAANRPKADEPESLRRASRALADADRWARILGQSATADGLADRLARARVEFEELPREEIDEIARKAQERLDALVAQARAQRQQRHRSLADDLEFLSRCFGAAPRVQQLVDALNDPAPMGYLKHEHWLKDEARAKEEFWEQAASFKMEMDGQLTDHKRELADRAALIGGLPLRDDHRRELTAICGDIAGLRESMHVQDTLAALRTAGDLGGRLDRLEQAARAALKEHEAERAEFSARRAWVQEAGLGLGLDLFPQLAKPGGDGTGFSSLAESLDALTRDRQELVHKERELLGRCQGRYRARHLQWTSGFDLLQRAELSDPLGADFDPAPPADLDAALAGLATLDRAWALVEQRVKELAAEYQEAIRELQSALERVDPKRLSPDQAAIRQENLRLIASALLVDEEDDDLLSRAELFEDTLEQARDFLQQHGQGAADLVKLRERFEEQLVRLTNFRLQQYYPRLYLHAAGLAHGLEHASPEAAARAQAEIVSTLLDATERHLLRLQAHEVAVHAAKLRQRLEGSVEPRWRRSAEVALQRLDGVGPYDLPPLSLRLRLETLAGQIS